MGARTIGERARSKRRWRATSATLAKVPTADCPDRVPALPKIKTRKIPRELDLVGRGVRSLQVCSRGKQFSVTSTSAPSRDRVIALDGGVAMLAVVLVQLA